MQRPISTCVSNKCTGSTPQPSINHQMYLIPKPRKPKSNEHYTEVESKINLTKKTIEINS
uniref:Uncharacterized protein n=1 Tax=Rhizophora mucronata TaxID=61149 RepID=A0A2P2QAL3_RHIMU